LQAHNLQDFLALPPNPAPFHAYPILPRNGMMLVYGSTKQYKSFVTMNMGYEFAEGLPVLGVWSVTGGPKRVLLIEQECGQDEAQRRMREIHNKRQGKFVEQNLWVVSKDLDCVIDDPELKVLNEHVKMAKPQILILDPFSWFHSRPGNDNDEIKRVIKNLLKWQMKHDIATILNHHTTKKNEFHNGDGSDLNAIKGASALSEAASSIIGISQPTSAKTIKQLHFTFRHGAEPQPLKVQFQEDSGTFEHC
jgi:RecA-family ATPase